MKTKILRRGNFLLCSVAASFLISRSTNKTLVLKERTNFGVIKFYTQEDIQEKKILVDVDNAFYYRIDAKETIKHEREHKELTYTLYYGPFEEEDESLLKHHKSLSKLDSLVLFESDRILDSLNWKTFTRAKGASAFKIEVAYYHGVPRNKKFKPLQTPISQALKSLPYYTVIFTSTQSENTLGYSEVAAQMEQLAQQQTGYLGMDYARSDIGITISYWQTEADILNWKNNLEHLKAQHLGKTIWHDSYSIRICKVEREYHFKRSED